MIDDPDFVVAAGGDGDGLEAHRYGAASRQPALLDLKDLESTVRRVDSKEELSIGRERERAPLAALERGERRRGGRGACCKVIFIFES
jgi:hypothetical protein